MSLPKATAAYEPQIRLAIERALSLGEFRIPCADPKEPLRLRLRFQGFRGAARREGLLELADGVAFYVEPDAFIIRAKDRTAIAYALDAALGTVPTPTDPLPLLNPVDPRDAAEAALDRILGLR